MAIGAAARACGASPKALRLYESMGLLGRVQRIGRYRVYSAAQLRRVVLVRQALALGVRLADLRQALGVGHAPDWQALAALVQERAAQLQAGMRALRTQHTQLQAIHAALLQCDGVDGAVAGAAA
ncbi:MAG: MerR family transcriptional regulator [Rhodoferax sp.]